MSELPIATRKGGTQLTHVVVQDLEVCHGCCRGLEGCHAAASITLGLCSVQINLELLTASPLPEEQVLLGFVCVIVVPAQQWDQDYDVCILPCVASLLAAQDAR